MNSVRFPKRSDDGSFCVEIGVRWVGGVQEDLVLRIGEWVSGVWMPRNETWVQEWKTGSDLEEVRIEELQYSDEFSGPPEIVMDLKSELLLRLRGRKTAKFWKDWLVLRLMPDLKEAFPGVGELLYIRNCASVSIQNSLLFK